jgi:hypothetical protein
MQLPVYNYMATNIFSHVVLDLDPLLLIGEVEEEQYIHFSSQVHMLPLSKNKI